MNNIPEDVRELLRVLESAARTENETPAKVRLPNGQLARLSFERDEAWGYKSAKLSLEMPRVERAVIAALTALNGREVDPRRVRRSIYVSEWQREALHSLAGREPRSVPPAVLKGATAGDVRAGRGLGYLQVLLRHYRPDFDNMSKEEQIALTTRVVQHANEFLGALRKLSACLEHGHPHRGLPTTPVRRAARDVRAAELRDIDGLTYKEIGSRLGVEPYKHDAYRNDNTPVRMLCVPNGRATLKKAMGLDDEGYDEYVKDRKTETQRWGSLAESRRWAELFAQDAGIPAERLHHVITCGDEDLANEICQLKNEVPELDEDQIASIAWTRASWEFYGDEDRSQASHP